MMKNKSFYKSFFKNIFDFIFSLLLIIFLLPLLILISIFIYYNLGKPFLFKQKRIGINSSEFIIYKFRTLTNTLDTCIDNETEKNRRTNFGDFLRKYSLDELPQLFNILLGNMSFVGPRPLLPEYLKLYNNKQNLRHLVKPGLTGLAQINGRNAISWEKKFEFDLHYVNSFTFIGDLKIIIKTIKIFISGKGVNKDNSQSMEKFEGNKYEI